MFAMKWIVSIVPNELLRLAEHCFDLPIRGVVRKCPSLFIHIPRCAGTRINMVLYGRFIGHRTALWYKIADPRLFERKYKFAVVRDPVDRFVSAFFFLQAGGTADVPASPRTTKLIRKFKSIDEFMGCVDRENMPLKKLDPVFHAQSDYVLDEHGRLIVDDLFVLDEISGKNLSIPDHVIDMGIVTNNSDAEKAVLDNGAIERFVLHHYASDHDLLAKHSGKQPRRITADNQIIAKLCS